MSLDSSHHGLRRHSLEEKAASGVWLHAWDDAIANLNLSRQCLITADLLGDGDYKIVAALANRKLQVLKGKVISTEVRLLEEPTAIEAIYPEMGAPQTPMLAIACDSVLYIYRHLRPFYKFSVPGFEPDPNEVDVWKRLSSDALTPEEAVDALKGYRREALTARSRCLLSLQSATARAAFIASVGERPLGDQPPITCLTSLAKSSDEERAVSLVVLGVESGQVLILTQTGMKVAKQIDIGMAPAFMDVVGQFDVNYRIVIAGRNNRVLTIKNGRLIGAVIETPAEICGIVLLVKCIVVACMNDLMYGFHAKGQAMWSVPMPAPITALGRFQLRRASNLQGAIVALNNGEVRLYDGNVLLSSVTCPSAVVAIKLGKYGREDASLIMVQETGGIVVKILQRQAQLDAPRPSDSSLSDQDRPLPIPKRTQLYVDQMKRERNDAVRMHKVFQLDLAKLRLMTAKTFMKVASQGYGGVAHGGLSSTLHLHAQVLGIGPRFKVRLALKNSGTSVIVGTVVALSFDHGTYDVRRPLLTIPVIIPAVNLHTDVEVRATGRPGPREVWVMVCGPAGGVPIITAVVVMPIVNE